MRAETIINTLLNASSSLAVLVSTRIYLDTRPEADPLPAVVYELISDRQDNSSPDQKERCTARMQINCMDLTAEGAVAVREAVRLACHNQAGDIGGFTVVDCLQDGAGADSYDQLVNIYLKPIDFVIHYLR